MRVDTVDSKTLELAMHRAKEKGKNGFSFFTSGLNERMLRRLGLEAEAEAARERAQAARVVWRAGRS